MTSTLLDGGASPTLWVDREGFNAGRLASYLEVPSNTKTSLFSEYARMSSKSTSAEAALANFKVRR